MGGLDTSTTKLVRTLADLLNEYEAKVNGAGLTIQLLSSVAVEQRDRKQIALFVALVASFMMVGLLVLR